eukprot:6363-Heterococcus_DN1.PRE.1
MQSLLTHAVNCFAELLQVANDLRRGCVGSDCKTGGDVLTVFWAVLQALPCHASSGGAVSLWHDLHTSYCSSVRHNQCTQGAMSIGQCGPNFNAIAQARGAAGHLEQVICWYIAVVTCKHVTHTLALAVYRCYSYTLHYRSAAGSQLLMQPLLLVYVPAAYR